MKDEGVKTIITFKTPSGTEWQASSDPRRFVPNLFIEVSEEVVNTKINKFEKRKWPHPRSAEALKIFAKRTGAIIGSDLSEAFHLVRSISR